VIYAFRKGGILQKSVTELSKQRTRLKPTAEV
jgi:hypothetical protein